MKSLSSGSVWEDIYELLVGCGAAMGFVALPAIPQENLWVRIGFATIAIVLVVGTVYRTTHRRQTT